MLRTPISVLFFVVLLLIGSAAVAQCTAPPAPTAADATICSGQTVVLSATGSGTIGWYDAATGGNWLGGSSSFTTPVLTATTLYYVQDSTCAASTTRKAVTVTVNPLPVAGFSVSSLVCSGVAAKFNASAICGNNPALSFTTGSGASRALISLATDNITMEIWAKWNGNNNGANQILFYNGHTGNGGYGIVMHSSGIVQILAGGVSYMNSTVILKAGIWQHLAIVRNNGTWSLYIDGIASSISYSTTVPRAPNVAAGNQLSIGYAQDGTQQFMGELDEAKFWTVVRNPTQIQSDMINCVTTATSGLLAYWGFSEGTGSTTADGSGNNYTLSVNNTSWVSSGAPLGNATYAWDFGDGSSSSLRGDVHSYASNGTKTVSLTVTDQLNCSATNSSSVVVNQSPAASISGTATNCSLVTLTASGDGPFSWSGGNSTGTAVNTFSSSGTYTVTVTSTEGCTTTASQTVVVNPIPAAPVNGPLPTISAFVSGIFSAKGIAFDTAGNLFVSDNLYSRIRKVTPDGTVSTFLNISSPQGICTDMAGNVYVSSSGTVKKISSVGTLIATYSSFSSPYGLQINSSGKLYVAERTAGSIKTISSDGSITTFVTGLSSPAGIVLDTAGNLYVTEQISSGTVKKITPEGFVSVFATGLNSPYGITIDGSGNLFVAESSISRSIVKITPDGTKTTYVTPSSTPQYLVMDRVGNLYTSTSSNMYKIVPAVNNITTIIDSGSVTLIATPATGSTVDWYDQTVNGSLLQLGNTNYIISQMRNTTTFYAEARNATTGCISAARTPVTVTVLYNKLTKNGKSSTDGNEKISKNGAVGGTGINKNGKIIEQ